MVTNENNSFRWPLVLLVGMLLSSLLTFLVAYYLLVIKGDKSLSDVDRKLTILSHSIDSLHRIQVQQDLKVRLYQHKADSIVQLQSKFDDRLRSLAIKIKLYENAGDLIFYNNDSVVKYLHHYLSDSVYIR